MTQATAADDILEWANSKLELWQRDALRRLACAPLSEHELLDLLNMVKHVSGFALSHPHSVPVPIEASHIGASASSSSVCIKAIRDIKNINRLSENTELSFKPDGLTVIYGTNGSGKTGFIRILRRICRTRITDQKKLKVLSDVYRGPAGPLSAEVVIETPAGEQSIVWSEQTPASDLLLRAAVFDTSAAEFYVDQGNHIRFLPFGLALPHKLNDLMQSLKKLLDSEHQPIVQQLSAANVAFSNYSASRSQKFYRELNAKTTDSQIDAMAKFGDADADRLAELNKVLVGSREDVADRRSLATWLDAEKLRLASVTAALTMDAVNLLIARRIEMNAASKAAKLSAKVAFADDPLEGIGNETWKRLWDAARIYSVEEAYPGRPYPVTTNADADALCVLCQQPISREAQDRMNRFEAFINGHLSKKAIEAQAIFDASYNSFKQLDTKSPMDAESRLKQLEARDVALVAAVRNYSRALKERHEAAMKVIMGEEEANIVAALPSSPLGAMDAAAKRLAADAQQMDTALNAPDRLALEADRQELIDRQRLSQSIDVLKRRRDLLRQDDLYKAASSRLQTRAITQKANELLDKHLTAMVANRFSSEARNLKIDHLKISLSRESSKTEASFKTDSGSKLARVSEILSEGEQRALALAGFFTEVTIAAPDGPIIIDDPVSSLDRERSAVVAARLVEEAQRRQVIVFTHDLLFYNEICRIADENSIDPLAHRVFRNANGTGIVDKSGGDWKAMKVSKRIGLIVNEMARIRKLHDSEPSRYEFESKNIYSRLRDAYERTIEECIFRDTISRFNEVIKTQNLRYISLPDDLALRFHFGMTKANTFSHDNPSAGTACIPAPGEIDADITALKELVSEFEKLSKLTEANRPQMKPH